MSDIATQLAAIVVLGIAAQLIADRLRVPSILLLLSLGVIAGPLTGYLDPDELMGDLLAPLVSIAVGIILFEGGLGLRLRELHGVRRAMWLLVSVGTVVTLLVASAAAMWVLDLPAGIALLLGCILVVSGPTVVGPLLRVVRPSRSVATVLEWEGIIIDPIGAMLAVVVFEAVLRQDVGAPVGEMALFVVCGLAVGAGIAAVMVVLLERFWVPDFLRSSVTLAMVVLAFTVANELVAESGLLATIVLGMALANQSRVAVRDIAVFSENLRIPIISILFIVLAARLEPDHIRLLGWEVVVLIGMLILIARPLAVAISTVRTRLTGAERVVLAAVAPRGIVAASISSVFAQELADEGVAGAEYLVPVTFAVIIATVVVYGLGAPVLSRRLGVTRPDPSGVLIVGGDEGARAIARAVHDAGAPVLVLAGNRQEQYLARMQGIPARHENVLGPAEDVLEFDGLGAVLAMTDNDEFNTLVCAHLSDEFGPRHTYQVSASGEAAAGHDETPAEGASWRRTPPRAGVMRGQWLFARSLHHEELRDRIEHGWTVRTTNLTDRFGWSDLQELHGGHAVPLFVVPPDGHVEVVTPARRAPLTAGNRVITLVPPSDGDGVASRRPSVEESPAPTP